MENRKKKGDYMKRYLKGSDWARWDLHVHTPYSLLNNDFGNPEDEETWDKYIFELIIRAKENDIVCIGLTDYFSIDGYIKINSVLKDGDRMNSIFDKNNELINYAKDILLLPNIELRLNTFVESDRSINYHILFSNELESDEIKNNFLESLKTYVDSSETDTIQELRLTRSNIERIGKKLKEEQGFKGNDYKVGLEHITVDLNNIIEILKKNDKFKTKYILLAPIDEDLSDIKWDGRSHQTRKNIIKSCHAFFTSNKNTRNWALGKLSDSVDQYTKEFSDLKPCVHGSDAHEVDRLFKCYEDRYCWIKAKPTFEGLLQILSEPEDRVRIQSTNPNTKNDYQLIDYIVISDEKTQDEKIYFSDNLTCIVGGRSTGKSLLLTNIVDAIDPEQRKEKEEISTNRLWKLDNVEVYWKDGKINSADNRKKIIYIPQSYLNRLIDEKEKDTEIDTIIREIMFQDEVLELKNKVRETENSNIVTDVSKKVIDLLSIHTSIVDLKEELKENGFLEDLNEEIEKRNYELKELLGNGENNEDIIEKLKESNDKTRKIENTVEDIKADLQFLKEGLNIEFIVSGIDRLNNSGNKELISKITIDLEEKINNFWQVEKKLVIESNEEKLDLYEKEFKILTEENEKLKKEVNRTEQIEIITEKINELENKKQKSEILLEEIEEKTNKLKTFIEDLKLIGSVYYSIAEKFKKDIDDRYDDIKTDYGEELNFKVEVNVKQETFKKNIKELFDNRCFSSCDIIEIKDNKFTYNEEFISILLYEILTENKLRLKAGKSKEEALGAILANYYNINYLVDMEGDDIDNMSPGKKSLVLLRLLIDMSKSDWPILIDQPEDDLDNRSIYNDLVKYIKNKKRERQIIIVTHNANIVVGADSEQIIIANQDGGTSPNEKYRFEYRTGGIEDNEITYEKAGVLYKEGVKDQVCKILEGGERAFELRSKKYFR